MPNILPNIAFLFILSLFFFAGQQQVEGLYCYAQWEIYGPPSMAIACANDDDLCMTTECAPPSGGSILVRGCSPRLGISELELRAMDLCEHMVGTWVRSEYCEHSFCNKQAKMQAHLPLALSALALILAMPLIWLTYHLVRCAFVAPFVRLRRRRRRFGPKYCAGGHDYMNVENPPSSTGVRNGRIQVVDV